MAVAVLVPGYGGRIRAVERWRMTVAIRTLDFHGGGRLVVSGHGGEAERLAALAPATTEVAIEPTAHSSFENVERSLRLLRGAEQVAVASDRSHRRRIVRYLRELDPDLYRRLVDPDYGWRGGWWMDGGGAVYAALIHVRATLSRRLKE